MERVPQPLLLEIIAFLDLHQFFTEILAINKNFRSFANCHYLLELLVKCNLRLECSQRISMNQCYKLLRHILRGTKKEYLEFLPCSTDGGADEDQDNFWFGHVFEYNDKPWCTLEGVLNANASAVLANTQAETRGYHWANKEAIKIVKEWLARKGKRLYKKNEHIAVAIFSHVATNFPLDAISIDEANPEEFKATIREIFINLKPLNKGIKSIRRFKDKPYVLDMGFDKISAAASNNYFVINEFSISRKGGFTCPAKTLMVFVSFESVDILDDSLKYYNDLKRYEDLERLKEVHSRLFRLRPKVQAPGYEYCEFGKSDEMLKPVLWLNFLEESKKEEVVVRLAEEVSGKYVYFKLVCPEDRREERNWNHEFLNIDCNYIVPKGRVIKIV